MLSAWYFCCCIKAEPHRAATLLSVLENVRALPDGEDLARLSLDELAGMDIWMRSYAIPDLLRLGGTEAGRETKGRAFRLLLDLATSLSEDLPDSFEDLVRSLDQESAERILTLATRCAEAAERLPEREPSAVAYIDTREFLPEVLLLAVVSEWLRRSAVHAEHFREWTRRGGETALDRILHHSLQHECGRLAFLLALRIVHHSGGKSPKTRLARAIWTVAGRDPHLEPDLLRAWAELLFQDPDGVLRAGSGLLDELRGLTHFAGQVVSRPGQNPPRRSGSSSGLPRVPGFRAKALAVILWQGVLCELAAEGEDAEFLEALPDLWRIPGWVPTGLLGVEGPVSERDHDAWRAVLLPLLRLRGFTANPPVVLRRARAWGMDPEAWALFSPWIPLNPDDKVLKDPRVPRYPGAADPVGLVRLAAAVITGNRLLRLPALGDESRRACAAFAVHAADVLDDLHFRDDRPPPPSGRGGALPPEWTTLALFAHQSLQTAGKGEVPAIAPGTYVSLLQVADPEGAAPSRDHRLFFERVLPGVLVEWIADAFPGATRSSGNRCWLPWVADVCGALGTHYYTRRLLAAMLMRFLDANERTAAEDARFRKPFAWKPESNRASVRQLLLFPERCGEPVEEYRPQEAAPGNSLSFRIARGLGRLALARDAGVSEEPGDQGSSEWREALARVSAPTELDRFVRLRLLEVLGEPVLAGRGEDRVAIAYALLEYGSLFELERLFERLYPAAEPEWAATPAPDEQELREVLLRPMLDEVLRPTDDGAAASGARNPRHTRRDRSRQALMREVLGRVALFCPLAAPDEHRRRLSRVLRNAYAARMRERAWAPRQVLADCRREDGERDAEGAFPPEWSIRSLAFDPDVERAAIEVADPDLDGCLNLLDAPRVKAQAFWSARGTGTVLGVVAGSERPHRAPGGAPRGVEYLLNCGFDYLLRAHSDHRLERGDLVRVDVAWQASAPGGRTGRWQVVEDARPLPRRVEPGQLRPALVHARRRYGLLELGVEVDGRFVEGANGDVRDAWCPDLSWHAHGRVPREPVEVFAVLTGAPDRWEPAVHELPELLLEAGGSGDSLLVLTFLDDRAGDGWRFALRPGQLYRVRREDLAPGDGERLREELRDVEGRRGLLVSFRASIEDGAVRLRLARERPEDARLERTYPDLLVPFDERNILWRTLLHPGEEVVVERRQNQLVVPIEAPPSGFPAAIHAAVHGPRISGDSADVVVRDWNPRTASVQVEAIRSTRLRLRDGESEAGAAERWLQLREGDGVVLDRTRGRSIFEGEVLCATMEAVMVSVESRTLSMRMGPDADDRDTAAARQAVVWRVEWKRAGTAEPDLDVEEVLRSLPDADFVEGVIAAIPQDRASARFEVWWRGGGSAARSTVHIRNRAALGRVSLGARLRGWREGGRWRFQLDNPSIRARALWTVRELRPGDAGLCYLGLVAYRGERRAAAEGGPGELVLLRRGFPPARYGAIGDGNRFEGGIPKDAPVEVRPGREIGRTGFVQVQLRWNGAELDGTARGPVPAGSAALQDVRVEIWAEREHGVLVRRTFLLPSHGERDPGRTTPAEDDAFWQQRLDEYWIDPNDLKVKVIGGGRSVELLDTKIRVPDGRGGWTARVAVASGDGPYVLTGRYRERDALVRLVRVAGQEVRASFRAVPPRSLAQMRAELYAGLDVPHALESPLFYDGPESPGESAGSAQRFEWGYGRTALIPADRLFFNDEPFPVARKLLLFHGDEIGEVTFRSPRPEDAPTAGGEDQGSLSINRVTIRYSHARSLFVQRKKHRVVHVLKISAAPSEPPPEDARAAPTGGGEDGPPLRVQEVVGLNASSAEDPSQEYRVPHARLDAEGTRLARARLARAAAAPEGGREAASVTLLGRLDEETFENSVGRDVLFHYTPMRVGEEEETALHDGETVLVQAGEIELRFNDTVLRLHPVDGLDREDIGRDCADLRLTRRRFSVREYLLRDLRELNGRRALYESLLMVRLDRDEGRTTASLRGVPPRDVSVLRALVARGEDLAAVSRPDPVMLELRPGVLVRLGADDIRERPPELQAGAVVQVRLAPDQRFDLVPAVFDETRYVPAGTRPVVALPLNPLLRRDAADPDQVRSKTYWKRKLFSIGGLPSIVAMPGTYDPATGAWAETGPRDFVALMRKAHPKIALLGIDSDGVPRVAPGPGPDRVGALRIAERPPRPRFVPIGGLEGERGELPLDWEALSYADDTAAALAERVEQGAWTYHDSHSARWTEVGEVEQAELGSHTGASGPLFFQADEQGRLRLRFSADLLRRFGLPAAELARHLSRAESQRGSFAVAAPAEGGGLWIEIAPGRVVELSRALVATRTASREPHSLESLWWEAFAPGDRVTLSLASREPLQLDRFILEGWEPGPRGAFGSAPCFLPVAAHDAERGGGRLGAGDFQLTVPTVFGGVEPEVVALLPDNRVITVREGRLPQRGEVALLGLRPDGGPAVLGFPGLTPAAHRQPGDWGDDPLRDDILVDARPHRERLARFITAAGGVLPVTVEGVYQERSLFFTRRLQAAGSRLPAGTIALARLVGVLSERERTVLLRCGGGVLKCRIDAVLPGLPRACFTAAAEELRARRVPLWVRANEEGRLFPGLQDEERTEFRVVQEFALPGAESREGGLVCRSARTGALRWLPEREIAWTRLAPDELSRGVPSAPQLFSVHLRDADDAAGPVSFTGTSFARREFAALAVGRELGVTVISRREDPAEGPARFLVRSSASGVALDYAAEDGPPLAAGHALIAEVAYKRGGSRPVVSVTLAGSRMRRLDVPAWLVAGPGPAGAPRPEFQRFLGWVGERPEPVPPLPADWRALSPDDLARLLCVAWFHRDCFPDPDYGVRLQTGAAAEWWRQNGSRREVDLHYALLCALLLHQNASRGEEGLRALNPRLSEEDARTLVGEWHRNAYGIVQNVGRRARRSLHVEVLSRWSRGGPEVGSAKLGYRLAQLRRVMAPRLDSDAVQQIRRFVRAVELHEGRRSEMTAAAVASALRRALGELDAGRALTRSADITARLASLYSGIPKLAAAPMLRLQRVQTGELKAMLDQITAQSVDIVLLAPLAE